MKKNNVKRLAFWITVLSTVFVPIISAAQMSFDRIVVFGTSLSDPGNAYALIGWFNTPPYDTLDEFLVPDAPYARGGHHFSNGATWVEQYARSLDLAETTRPALMATDGTASNYAVGGARAREDGINFNIATQVQFFLVDFPATPSNALYVIEMGSNDIRDALLVDPTPPGPAALLAEALEAITSAITTLYNAGARQFLILNVADISLTPAVLRMEVIMPGTAAYAQLLSISFNEELSILLDSLESSLPKIKISRLDIFAKMNDIADDPAGFGLTETEEACITPNIAPFTRRSPDEYLFWDGVHPTRATHGIIADDVSFVLAE